jgi:hypothetical protein
VRSCLGRFPRVPSARPTSPWATLAFSLREGIRHKSFIDLLVALPMETPRSSSR